MRLRVVEATEIHMKNIDTISAFLFLIYTLSVGQIKLAGEQDGVFDSATYIVSEELIVPEGKKLDFLPNARLLFLPYVGIRVDGQLKMRKTILSSKDSTGNWVGIEVGQKGKIDFSNVSISRSIMGIGVPDSTAIEHFDNITFENNKSTLRIDDSPIFIREGIPFTFSKVTNDPKEEKRKFSSDRLLNSDIKKIPSLRAGKWISTITALTCLAGCVIFIVESHNEYDKYKQQLKDPVKAQEYRKQSLLYRNVAVGTGINAGVAGVAFTVCFAINHKKD
jgi:hypothetical protein